MAKLISGKEYDPQRVIHDSQCTCGKPLKFECYPDVDEQHYAAECECGLTIRLNQSCTFECSIEKE